MSNNEASESREVTPQVFPAAISPQQRFTLVQLISSSQAALVQGADERARMKRFRQAFGLEPLFAAARENGTVNSALAQTKKSAAFMLTLENVEFFLNVVTERLPMSGPQALVMEPLIDALQDAKSKSGIESLPRVEDLYDPAAEDWSAPKPIA